MANDIAVMEQVLMTGDLAKLSAGQRIDYYARVCESVGLNPYTRPFDYITLNGKMTLYAKKDAADQLRAVRGISISKPDITYVDDLIIVAVEARDQAGRTDSDLGVVNIGTLKGEARANAIMKAITKAKRRVTLSIAGLGWLDETEIDSVPSVQPVVVDQSTGEIIEQRAIEDKQGEGASEKSVKYMHVLGKEKFGDDWRNGAGRDFLMATVGKESTKGMTQAEVSAVIEALKADETPTVHMEDLEPLPFGG